MAALNFENALLKFVFQTGVNEEGKAILTTKNFQNVRPNVEADQLAQVVQAITQLSSYPLSSAVKIETENIEF